MPPERPFSARVCVPIDDVVNSCGQRPTMTGMIYTIGHSNHPIGRFTALLAQHGITALADVRSTPFSRFNPQFNREALKAALAQAGIQYVFLGDELGARSRDPDCFDGDRVSYARLAASAAFRAGLQRLLKGASEHRIAVMCAEREPLDCHRTILVTRELEKAGVSVTHILPDGTLEDHRHTMERLVKLLKLDDGGAGRSPDLFRTEADLFEEAYELQGARIAYVRK